MKLWIASQITYQICRAMFVVRIPESVNLKITRKIVRAAAFVFRVPRLSDIADCVETFVYGGSMTITH